MCKKIQNVVSLKIILIFVTIVSCKNKSNIITIPVNLETGRPVVNLTINGKGPYKFIFDTGSSGNIIDKELAEQLKLEVIGENQLRTPGSDQIITSNIVNTESVKIKDWKVFDETSFTTTALRSMLPIDGIISITFFNDYLLTIDYKNSILHITKGNLNPNDEGVISYSQEKRILTLQVDIDGNSVEAHLDSGNPGSIGIPYALKEKLKFESEPVSAGEIKTPVASFNRWEAKLTGDVSIGGIIYHNPDVFLIERAGFVNLGRQIFMDLIISIDQKNKLIKFEKS